MSEFCEIVVVAKELIAAALRGFAWPEFVNRLLVRCTLELIKWMLRAITDQIKRRGQP